MKVLVVDDDEIVCNGLKQVIPWDELGIELVGSALNGEKAYCMSLQYRPDVVISDICMPIMDGLMLSKKIKETLDDTIIIIMSAYGDFEYARKALQYGVKDYILKPIDPKKVQNLIELLKEIKKEKIAKKNATQDYFDGKMKKELIKLIHTEDEEKIIGYLTGKIDEYSTSRDDIKGICLQSIDVLYLYLEEIGIRSEASNYSKSNIIGKILSLKSYDDIQQTTIRLFENMLNCINRSKQSHSVMLASMAKKIVDEEYMNESMSLQYLSDKLGISTQHISSMFGQTCGMNFSDYLVKVRVEKACELLKDVTLKINDVSSKVGYSDSHYFTRVFKRVMHKTPSEFRSMVENANF